MITPDPTAFPGNIVSTIVPFIKDIDTDVQVHMRPLQTTDDIQSVGIYATRWEPDLASQEMRGQNVPGYATPTLAEYYIEIQTLVKDGDSVRGIATHSTFARRVYATVARTNALRVALGQLTHADLGVTEKARDWTINQQRYIADELGGVFMYLSVTELCFRTIQS